MGSALRRAGSGTYRGTLPQMMADGWHNHADVFGIISCLGVVTAMNYSIWLTSAKDPRYYFGSDQASNWWKKYMSEKMWNKVDGLGIRMFNYKMWYYGKAGDPSFDNNMLYNSMLGFKQQWRRDLYKLIVEVESANPADYPPLD